MAIWLPRHCNARHHARSSSVITLGMGRSLIVLVPTCKCFASIDLHSGIYVSRSQSRASIFECSVYSTTSPICRSKSSPRKHSGISLHRHASRSHIRRKARSARNRYINYTFAALYEILQQRIGIIAIGELPGRCAREITCPKYRTLLIFQRPRKYSRSRSHDLTHKLLLPRDQSFMK